MSTRGAFPTYIPEVDQKILLETDDANLFRACNIDPYVESICNDEIFWRNRTLARYSKLVKFRKGDVTWKAFYRRLVNDSMYNVDVGVGSGGLFVYSNIIDAYNRLWQQLNPENYLTPEQFVARYVDNPWLTGFTIKLTYKGEVAVVNDEYLLYNNTNLAKDILEYPELPALNVKGRELWCYTSVRMTLKFYPGHNMIIPEYDDTPYNRFQGVFDKNDEIMRSFIRYLPPYTPDYSHKYSSNFYVLTMNSGNSGTNFKPFIYGYTKEMPNKPAYQTFLVDAALFGKPPKFDTFVIKVGYFPSDERIAQVAEQIANYYNEQ